MGALTPCLLVILLVIKIISIPSNERDKFILKTGRIIQLFKTKYNQSNS